MPQRIPIEDGLKASIFKQGLSVGHSDMHRNVLTHCGSATTVDDYCFQPRPSNFQYWKFLSKQIKTTFTDEINYEYMADVESSSLTIKSNDILDQIQKDYDIKDIISVNDFLQKNYSFFNILLEAPEIIAQVFGDEIKLSIEINDYEDDDMEELIINILSKYSPEETIELQSKLDDLWALNVYKNSNGKIVTVVNVS